MSDQTLPSGNPATRIIARFGGLSRAAQALHKPKSTLQRWRTSGYIHPGYYPDILRAAVEGRIRLEIDDFNHVDPSHPAFSEPKTASPDNTAGHAAGSSPRPTPDTELSPQLEGRPDQSGADSRGFASVSSADPRSIAPAGAGSDS
jgi:hypothetical protein